MQADFFRLITKIGEVMKKRDQELKCWARKCLLVKFESVGIDVLRLRYNPYYNCWQADYRARRL